MTLQVAKFSTQAEAETRQVECLADWLAENPVNGYKCDRWDTPKQRTDGDWTIFTCPCTDHSGDTVLDYDVGDYPSVPDES